MQKFAHHLRCAAVCALPAVALSQTTASPQWAPSVSFPTAGFDARPIAGIIRDAANLDDLSVRGKSWDVGAARGRPGHSYFRLAFTEVRVKNGSFIVDDTTKSVTEAVVLRGIRAERVSRLAPRSWPVAPMLTAHGGIGKISGRVNQTITNWIFDPARWEFLPETSTRTKDARDFSVRWIPMGGIGLGLTSSIKDRLTVTIAAFGLDLPGVYKAQVHLVYWPKGPSR